MGLTTPALPAEAARQFGFDGTLQVTRFGSGLINESYRLVGAGPSGFGSYLLQRLNPEVFPDGDAVMRNIAAVTRHLARGAEREGHADHRRLVLELLRCGGEALAWRAPDGALWRLYRFIERAYSPGRVTGPGQAFEVARAFGRFHALLHDYDGPQLAITIPGFHDTPGRLAQLEEVVARDPCGRVAGAEDEIGFIRGRAPTTELLETAAGAGALPRRIAHHDAKASNVLLDSVTDAALAVVDLDTVMPGLLLYDVGDLIRSVVCSVEEDDPEPASVMVRSDFFTALAEGFFAGLGEVRLAPAERELFVAAGVVITLEQGIRFLADHLAGDIYYRLTRPGQNLDRARVQLRFVAALEGRTRELQALVPAR